LFKNEAENRDYLFSKLKDNAIIMEHKCLVGTEIPIPYKHVYIPIRRSLEIWFFKQDICIYQKLFEENIRSRNITLNENGNKVLNVTLENNADKGKDIGLPLVVIETKMNHVTTNEILASSEKSKMIKSIFPFCKTFLLIFGDPPARVYRLCSGFDEILFMTEFDDKQLENIITKITNGLIMGYGIVPYVVSFNYPYAPVNK